MALTFPEFQRILQDAVREDLTPPTKRQRYLTRIKENNWQTIKDVPEDQRQAFVDYVTYEGEGEVS